MEAPKTSGTRRNISPVRTAVASCHHHGPPPPDPPDPSEGVRPPRRSWSGATDDRARVSRTRSDSSMKCGRWLPAPRKWSVTDAIS